MLTTCSDSDQSKRRGITLEVGELQTARLTEFDERNDVVVVDTLARSSTVNPTRYADASLSGLEFLHQLSQASHTSVTCHHKRMPR